MQTLWEWRREQGHFARHRGEQTRFWFQEEVRQGLLACLKTPAARNLMETMGQEITAGRLSAHQAARQVLQKLLP